MQLKNDLVPVKVEIELSEKEVCLLRMVASGLCNKEIAASMKLSVRTVKYHTARLHLKVGNGDHSRAGLVIFAYEHGIVKPKGRE
jgi:DNA-binding NarL/FixJ family response regulator